MKKQLIREVAGMAEYDLEPPEMRFPGAILQNNRMTDDQLVQLVTDKFARSTSDLDPNELFFFPAEISNQHLDSYFTKMAESSLRNYAADASEGVAFQNSHKSRELGVGMVINGEYVESATNKHVFTDIYTVRGLKLNADLDTDNFIKGVQTGLIRDVSIGFRAGAGYKESCNICGNEYWSYDCHHVAGMMYEVADDPESDPTNQDGREQLAFVWIENARLSEVSAVYDGATPDAMILTKALREGRAGRLSSQVRSQIEKRFHIDLAEPRQAFPGSNLNKEERQKPEDNNRSDKEMTDLEKALQRAADAELAARNAETKATEAEGRAREAEAKAEKAEARIAELEKAIRSSATDLEGVEVTDETPAEDIVRSIRSTADSLSPLASQAKQYRETEIENALKSGVRAYGDDFDKEKKRATLEKLDLVEIQETARDWEQRASGTFKGGRKSAEEGGDDPNDDTSDDQNRKAGTVDHSVPASAFNRI